MAENTKTKVAKMNAHKPTAKMVAEAAGADESTVYSVRAGRRAKGKKAKKIMEADKMLDEGINLLVKEVQRVVNV